MSTIKVDTIATRTGSGNITASNTIAGTSATLSGTLGVTGATTTGNITTGNTSIITAGRFISSQTSNDPWFKGVNSSNSETLFIKKDGQIYSAFGISLGGTGAANTLDDYEEGTFTSSPATGTYAFNNPTYTKIGRMVHCQAQIGSISENSSSTSFTVDLPFTAAANNRACVFGTLYVNVSRNPVVGGYLNSTSTLMIYLDNSFTQLQHADTASNTSIYIAFAYEAAS